MCARLRERGGGAGPNVAAAATANALPAAERGGSRSGLLKAVVLPALGGLVLLAVLLYGGLLAYRACGATRSFARVSYADHGPDRAEEDDEYDDEYEPDWSRGSMPVTFEQGVSGNKVSSHVSLAGVTNMAHIFAAVKKAATKALGVPVEHLSLQYMNAERTFDEAWWDPVLREGSDLKSVVRAREWRVLILGTQTVEPMEEEAQLVSVAL